MVHGSNEPDSPLIIKKKIMLQGDSGGPMIADGRLLGITSFGTSRRCSNGIVIYSNVHHFLDFIVDVVPTILR